MAIDDLAQKLAQDPRNRIIKVVWAPLGGMLFLWCSWVSAQKTIPPTGFAKVTGLPNEWRDFDLLDRNNDQIDTDKAFKNIPEGHSEPIDDDTLNKYLQWTPKDAIATVKDEIIPGTIYYYATTGGSVDKDMFFVHVPGHLDQCGRPTTYGSELGGGFLHCNYTVTDNMRYFGIPVPSENDGGGGNRALVEQYVSSIKQWASRVGSPWDSVFSTFFVGELDLSADAHNITRRQYGVLILNIKKLRRYQEVGAGGKKADTMTFNVEAPAALGTWNLEAWMISAMVPPKGDGIREFPLQAETLHPDWDHNSTPRSPGTNPDAKANFINGSDSPSVDVTIDFVKFEVAMKLNGKTNPPKEG